MSKSNTIKVKQKIMTKEEVVEAINRAFRYYQGHIQSIELNLAKGVIKREFRPDQKHQDSENKFFLVDNEIELDTVPFSIVKAIDTMGDGKIRVLYLSYEELLPILTNGLSVLVTDVISIFNSETSEFMFTIIYTDNEEVLGTCNCVKCDCTHQLFCTMNCNCECCNSEQCDKQNKTDNLEDEFKNSPVSVIH